MNYDNYNETEMILIIDGCPNIEKAFLNTSRIKELDISDCPYLISASEQTPYEEFRGWIYESEEGYIVTNYEQLVFIK